MSNDFQKNTINAFLDRDGVINHDKGYINNFRYIKFRKGVLKGLKYLTKINSKIFIITNQAGVAKGKITINELKKLNLKLIQFFKKKNIIIHEIKYCPHHPEGIIKKYKKKCKCRKPGNLLIKQVLKKWKVQKKLSFMIGDRKKDKIASEKSKIKFTFAGKDFYHQVKNICKKIEQNEKF